jgi:hypothetical protein
MSWKSYIDPRIARRRFETLLRHPDLIKSLPFGDAEMARMHLSKDLAAAPKLYNRLSTGIWDPSTAIKFFKDNMPCQHNAYLYAFCRHYKPRVVIETGVFYGGSSSFILKALDDNGEGHLYSVDLPNVSYKLDTGQFHSDKLPKVGLTGFAVPSYLRRRWTLIIGDARRELPYLVKNLGRCDLFHHDSAHTYDQMMFEFEAVWPSLSLGGVLISDDATWSKAFVDFCEKWSEPYSISEDIGFVMKTR